MSRVAPCESGPGRGAFTLFELLVVLFVIGLLLGLGLPALARAKERGRRIVCLNNVRQLLTASLLYAEDNERGSFTGDSRGYPDRRLDADDDLSPLYPSAIPSLPTFVCPSTKNQVRPEHSRRDPLTGQDYLVDLAGYDHGSEEPGMSYECFGVMGWTRRKTFNSVNTYQHQGNRYGLHGARPGAAQIWLILDGERGQNTLARGNHGRAGANVGFCDGHALWIQNSSWALAYELSQDEADQDIPLESRIGTY